MICLQDYLVALSRSEILMVSIADTLGCCAGLASEQKLSAVAPSFSRSILTQSKSSGRTPNRLA